MEVEPSAINSVFEYMKMFRDDSVSVDNYDFESEPQVVAEKTETEAKKLFLVIFN